jgi:hypothetical protein
MVLDIQQDLDTQAESTPSRRNLGADDLVDDDEFDEDDGVEASATKMSPANTKTDSEKSSNIKLFSQVTESEITRMLWCGESTSIILGQTARGQIYRSTDSGQTWEFKHDYNKLESSGGQLDQLNVKKASKIAEIVPSPVDSNLIFLIGSSGINWVSEDCGSNFKPLNNGRKISQFKFHPTQRNWAMAAIFTSCDDFEDDDEPCKIYREVYYTTDLGEHWNFLKDYVLEFEWAKASDDDNIDNELIFLLIQQNTMGHLDPSNWSNSNTLLSSKDFFKTSRTVVRGANRFAMMSEYIYAARSLKSGDIDLVMSERSNQFKTFHKVKFPTKNTYKSFEYNLMESWSGAVFLFINHHKGSENYGSVYLSDANGKGFSLTLSRVPLGSSEYADIEEVNSVEGVIIANKYSKSEMNKRPIESQAVDSGVLKKLKNKAAIATKRSNRGNTKGGSKNNAGSTSSTKTRYAESLTKKQIKTPMKTYISMNRGGSWSLLAPPDKTARGKSIKCKVQNGCSLHLHSYSSPIFPVPYSHQNAIGMIMGVGNLGNQLKFDAQEINTYMSRDGGLTWSEIMNGAHILEFGDHGGLIVMAPIFKPTKTILYSWDEGISWIEYPISQKELNIDAIEVEPSSKAMHFIISARRAKTSTDKGFVFTLDFTDLHQPTCQGISSPDTESSDYETWTPYDGRHGDKCFLGKKITYVRRKRDRECINSEDKEAILYQENCQCTEMDFECDSGYKRSESGQCETVKNMPIEPPEDCSGYYSISKGYRRIPGDTCEGGGEYDPILLACPNTWTIFSFRTFMILLLLGGAYYVITESDWIVNLFDWVNSKWSNLQSGANNDNYKYSKEMGSLPESVGDSDDDEKIISNTEGSITATKRGNNKDDMEKDPSKAPEQELIDIDKYNDSEEEDDNQRINA